MTARQLLPNLLRAAAVCIVGGLLLGYLLIALPGYSDRKIFGSYFSLRITVVIVAVAAWCLSWVAGRVAEIQTRLLLAPLGIAAGVAALTWACWGDLSPRMLRESDFQFAIVSYLIAYFAAALIQISSTRE